MLIILGSIVNMTRGYLYDHLVTMRIHTLIMNIIFMQAPKVTIWIY